MSSEATWTLQPQARVLPVAVLRHPAQEEPHLTVCSRTRTRSPAPHLPTTSRPLPWKSREWISSESRKPSSPHRPPERPDPRTAVTKGVPLVNGSKPRHKMCWKSKRRGLASLSFQTPRAPWGTLGQSSKTSSKADSSAEPSLPCSPRKPLLLNLSLSWDSVSLDVVSHGKCRLPCQQFQ